MPYVYVINEPTNLIGDRLIDLTPALEFGQLRYLLSSGRLPSDPQIIVDQVRSGLKNFEPEDYLLLTGNPVAIGVATALAAQRTGGLVKMLRWQGRYSCYQELCVNLKEPQLAD